MTNGDRQFKVIGLCDDESTCGFCGRTDLQRVVAFEDVETGEVLYAGTTCAQTVRLIVIVDGEAAPRKAREILTLAERATREAKIAAALEVVGWQVAAFVVRMQGTADLCPRPVEISAYTSSPAAIGLDIQVPTWVAYNASARERAIIAAARNWAIMVDRVHTAKTLAKREALAGEWSARIADLISKAPRTEW